MDGELGMGWDVKWDGIALVSGSCSFLPIGGDGSVTDDNQGTWTEGEDALSRGVRMVMRYEVRWMLVCVTIYRLTV